MIDNKEIRMRHRSTGTFSNRVGGYRIACLTLWLAPALLLAPTTAWAQLTPNQLEELRRQGEREGWTFTVSRNPACEYSLEQLTGMVEPPDWWKTARFPCSASGFGTPLPSRGLIPN